MYYLTAYAERDSHFNLSERMLMEYLIRNNFRMHLISRIWNTNILRALIFAILEKMIMQADLEDRSLLTDHLNND